MHIPTLNYIAGHEGGSVVVALQQALGEVALYLQAEQVARELLLELRRIRRVELDAEPEERIDQRQPHLPANWFLEVQPVLRMRERDERVCVYVRKI